MVSWSVVRIITLYPLFAKNFVVYNGFFLHLLLHLANKTKKWPMSSSSNGTFFPCKCKVKGMVLVSRCIWCMYTIFQYGNSGWEFARAAVNSGNSDITCHINCSFNRWKSFIRWMIINLWVLIEGIMLSKYNNEFGMLASREALPKILHIHYILWLGAVYDAVGGDIEVIYANSQLWDWINGWPEGSLICQCITGMWL